MSNGKVLEVALTFHPVGTQPIGGGPFDTFLLYNQCDGMHIAYSWWDDDGNFVGFFDFLGENEFREDFYEAWAKLPDCNDVLFPVFGSTPSRAAVAIDAALMRLRASACPQGCSRPEQRDGQQVQQPGIPRTAQLPRPASAS